MTRSKRLFEFFILAGLIAALYLYAFAFNDFSETELVYLSYAWIGALVFGTHGLLGYEFSQVLTDGEAAKPLGEILTARRQLPDRSFFSKVATLFLWSFLLTTPASTRHRPLACALLATVIWVAGLMFFFEVIFPEL